MRLSIFSAILLSTAFCFGIQIPVNTLQTFIQAHGSQQAQEVTPIPWRECTGDLDNFWEIAHKCIGEAGKNATETILSIVVLFKEDTKDAIHQFQRYMNEIFNHARDIRDETITYLETHNATFEIVVEELSLELGKVFHELENEVMEELPENHSDRAKSREKTIRRFMEKIRLAYIKVFSKYEPAERAEAQLDVLESKITRLVLVVGNICDDYPSLITAIIFASCMMLLTELAFIRIILSMFGFGPLGPIKGSLAAWIQRRFWGKAVPAGSFFAVLQSLAMTLKNVNWFMRWVARSALAVCLGIPMLWDAMIWGFYKIMSFLLWAFLVWCKMVVWLLLLNAALLVLYIIMRWVLNRRT